MRIIVDASGNVVMWSVDCQPTPSDGQTAIDLSPQQETAFLAMTGSAREGISFDGQSFIPISVTVPPPGALTVDQKLALIGLTVADIQGAILESQAKGAAL